MSVNVTFIGCEPRSRLTCRHARPGAGGAAAAPAAVSAAGRQPQGAGCRDSLHRQRGICQARPALLGPWRNCG